MAVRHGARHTLDLQAVIFSSDFLLASTSVFFFPSREVQFTYAIQS